MLDIPIPDKEFFSIGEVSRLAQVPAYVLRYWESEFNLLRPQRRVSNQRKYTRREIELIFSIKDLLYTRKFTIAGAKKYLTGDKRKKKNSFQFNLEMKNPAVPKDELLEIRRELEDVIKLLKQ